MFSWGACQSMVAAARAELAGGGEEPELPDPEPAGVAEPELPVPEPAGVAEPELPDPEPADVAEPELRDPEPADVAEPEPPDATAPELAGAPEPERDPAGEPGLVGVLPVGVPSVGVPAAGVPPGGVPTVGGITPDGLPICAPEPVDSPKRNGTRPGSKESAPAVRPGAATTVRLNGGRWRAAFPSETARTMPVYVPTSFWLGVP